MKTVIALSTSALLWTAALAGAVAAASQLDLQKLAGVYKHRFPDALVTGETYQGENILEIVPVSAASAYVRVHIDANNGHTCNISGLARPDHSALTLRTQAGPATCALSLAQEGQSLVLGGHDNACKAYVCGARAGFQDHAFDLSGRRPIPYV